ncbi:MAG: hypothetical protein AAGU77_07330 [Bacillota bacterium]
MSEKYSTGWIAYSGNLGRYMAANISLKKGKQVARFTITVYFFCVFIANGGFHCHIGQHDKMGDFCSHRVNSFYGEYSNGNTLSYLFWVQGKDQTKKSA